MKLLRQIANFLVYSNFVVALCGLSFALGHLYLNKIHSSHFSYSILFSLAVFFIYGLQRIYGAVFKSKGIISKRDAWYIRHYLVMYVLLALSAIIIVVLTFLIGLKLFLWLAPLLLVSIFYFYGPVAFKSLPGLKSVFIS